MNENNQFIRFDWAAKRMLRDKANFGVIEGCHQHAHSGRGVPRILHHPGE